MRLLGLHRFTHYYSYLLLLLSPREVFAATNFFRSARKAKKADDKMGGELAGELSVNMATARASLTERSIFERSNPLRCVSEGSAAWRKPSERPWPARGAILHLNLSGRSSGGRSMRKGLKLARQQSLEHIKGASKPQKKKARPVDPKLADIVTMPGMPQELFMQGAPMMHTFHPLTVENVRTVGRKAASRDALGFLSRDTGMSRSTLCFETSSVGQEAVASRETTPNRRGAPHSACSMLRSASVASVKQDGVGRDAASFASMGRESVCNSPQRESKPCLQTSRSTPGAAPLLLEGNPNFKV